VALLAGQASPAPASNSVTVQGSTIAIQVPVQVRGALEGRDGLNALARVALPLSTDRLHGCFSVRPAFADGEAPDAHVVTVLPQRIGQFLRPSQEPGIDPYATGREITVGERSLADGAPLGGPVALLLSRDLPPGGAGAMQSLLASIVEQTGVAGRLKPCRWTGSLELSATYERYHLTVRGTVPFAFTVAADGTIRGSVKPSTRDATSEDPEVGHCEASDLAMFKIGLTGEARAGRFDLTFRARSAEPDFKMSCARGTVSIGGDYLRAAFLPLGAIPFELRQRGGATATVKNEQQGRNATAKVTIRRG
jgi:hypothetical protein